MDSSAVITVLSVGGEHCLDTGGHKGLGSHLHLSRGGTVLFNVLDALAVAERLGIGNGWVEASWLRSYSRPMVSMSG